MSRISTKHIAGVHRNTCIEPGSSGDTWKRTTKLRLLNKKPTREKKEEKYAERTEMLQNLAPDGRIK